MRRPLVSGVLPTETPRWWIWRRTNRTWQDLIIDDDATYDYFHEKLRMTRGAFYDIVATCTPFLQWSLTHYRTPLLSEQLVAFALYRWASGETFDSATSSFGMGWSSGIKAVRDVTNAILSAYLDKIAMPTGRRLLQVTRAFATKRFPNCFGSMDCSHVYVDKPANAPTKNYFDRKQQLLYSVIAQAVVDLDMRVLDVRVGYPGSVHDAKVLINSSLYKRAEAGTLFLADAVDLPYGVRMRGYVLADNDNGPLPWLIVPYGVVQPPDEAHFDTCYKSSRNVGE
ncbi:hypothetical protein CBR_g63102 [Chara braunii]|uniref:DDE Tnp4 domain-containing protein n=1 Tax=Chara braunii TaxID=69332 RepID=A0A388K8Z8_CHABU|nr:hypothetical protein CBR_g63102 [Chara braunii]|eukprot:GBG66520.1 hypothetical protein CBR_g63102 [Chara braunii]